MKNSSENVSSGNTLIVESSAAPGEEGGRGFFSALPLKPQDRYKFIRSIGFGGMKGVLLVHDRDTDREMAMAIMPDFRERSASELERFAREAYLTARLEHPNIVPVYDIGIDESGSPFFTMKPDARVAIIMSPREFTARRRSRSTRKRPSTSAISSILPSLTGEGCTCSSAHIS